MKRLLAAPLVALVWLVVRGIEAWDWLVVLDPDDEAWAKYEDADE